jgi:hypothetical protein
VPSIKPELLMWPLPVFTMRDTAVLSNRKLRAISLL